MKRPLAALLSLSLLFAASADAQDMPGTQVSLILSRGSLIRRIDNADKLPVTFSQIRDNKLIVPVAAGKLLLRFSDKRLRSADGNRELVLTEDGVWGYQLDDSGLFETEKRLRQIHEDNRKHYVMVKQDVQVHLPDITTPVLFGRGEIYATQADAADGSVNIELSADKRADIAGLAAANSDTVPDTVALPAEKLAAIDIDQVLPADVYFGTRKATSKKDYAKIFAAWPKAQLDNKFSSYKECGTSTEKVTASSDLRGTRIETGATAEATYFDFLKVSLGTSHGEDEKKYETTFREISKLDDKTEVLVNALAVNEADEQHRLLFLIRNRDCSNDKPATWYSARSANSERYDFRIDTLDVPDSIKALYNPRNGVIGFRCYDEYLYTIDTLANTLGMREQDLQLALSHIAQVSDWRKFLSCSALTKAAATTSQPTIPTPPVPADEAAAPAATPPADNLPATDSLPATSSSLQ